MPESHAPKAPENIKELPREAQEKDYLYQMAREAEETGMYGGDPLVLGNASYSGLATTYQALGENINAARCHLLSTHGLSLENRERTNLTEEEFDEACKGATEVIKSTRPKESHEFITHPLDGPDNRAEWAKSAAKSVADAPEWLATQIALHKEHPFKK